MLYARQDIDRPPSMKTIWIINHYATIPEYGMGGRHRHFARELALKGHKVYLICAGWTHLIKTDIETPRTITMETFEGFQFVRLPTPQYKDAHDRQRILNWFRFALQTCRLDKTITEKPDVIYCSSLTPVSFLAAEYLARKYRARLVYEVRDIWPLTPVELGTFSARHPFIVFLQWIEDRAYRKSDQVISNLEGAFKHMVSRGMDRKKFSWISNGFARLDHQVSAPLNEQAMQSIPKSKFVIGYTGSIGLANALDILFQAALKLKHRTDICFVLIGDGREKIRFQRLVKENRLENVIFIDRIAKNEIPAALELFDACLLPVNDLTLYRFGISPNKLFDYFYAAKPVIQSYSGEYDLVTRYQAGTTVKSGDIDGLVCAILNMVRMPSSERQQMGDNGKKFVIDNHDYEILASKLEQILIYKN